MATISDPKHLKLRRKRRTKGKKQKVKRTAHGRRGKSGSKPTRLGRDKGKAGQGKARQAGRETTNGSSETGRELG